MDIYKFWGLFAIHLGMFSLINTYVISQARTPGILGISHFYESLQAEGTNLPCELYTRRGTDWDDWTHEQQRWGPDEEPHMDSPLCIDAYNEPV